MNLEHVDVLIVGAGISGISIAYNIQKSCPSLTYQILEGRENSGGTWDLCRYPGVRSDSDMYTLGFTFKPWNKKKSIAQGADILKYIKSAAKETNIENKIIYNQKVLSANWDQVLKLWQVEILNLKTNLKKIITSHFYISATGYYNYEQGHIPRFNKRENYKGLFIHPQSWDESIDYTDKKILIIGSGATAITLVPSLAKKAKKVIMLQRSPTYIGVQSSIDKTALFIKKYLPRRIANTIVRYKIILFNIYIYQLCIRFPKKTAELLFKETRKRLKDTKDFEKHFTPNYKPWTQRLCIASDGDFFKALNSEKAQIVTDHIDYFTETGIKTKSGEIINADIIISATGLKLQFMGGVRLSVQGKGIDPSDLTCYKGVMLSGIPNFAILFGYTNSSWSLKCELAGQWVTRILKEFELKKFEVVTPSSTPKTNRLPFMVEFSPSYVKRGSNVLPHQGDRYPWKLNQNYLSDLINYKFKPIREKEIFFN